MVRAFSSRDRALARGKGSSPHGGGGGQLLETRSSDSCALHCEEKHLPKREKKVNGSLIARLVVRWDRWLLTFGRRGVLIAPGDRIRALRRAAPLVTEVATLLSCR